MGTDALIVRIFYTNGTQHVYEVEDKATLAYLIHNEGDHVRDWELIKETEDDENKERGVHA